jgi:hypothetical protein
LGGDHAGPPCESKDHHSFSILPARYLQIHAIALAILVSALDDLEINRLTGERCFEPGSGIAAIGEDFRDPWEQPACLADEIGGTIAILDICREDLDAEHKTYRINERVTLDAFGFLPGVIADRILARPSSHGVFAVKPLHYFGMVNSPQGLDPWREPVFAMQP